MKPMGPGIYLVKAEYRQVGWHCAKCGFSPGGSIGSCHKFCGHCQEPLYTKDEDEALCEIQVFISRQEDGRKFRVLRQKVEGTEE